ncbi:hypothetical protein [Methylococcus mesophilus]|uniref:hypothetical protein n=1 Tax=Methylococcus mesophilus TaxID=2993564 RepID=UPI00224B9B11|nr:hypothetical protein [Methylococcus mesophilus]UZR27339.1 hypothetical protein OOT43_11390 [Methylococcus mesophilus]
MNKTKRLIISLSLMCLAAIAMPGSAAAASPNYVKVKFSLMPGDSKVISLPAGQIPIRVAVSVTSKNGGTQLPSELMTALVNKDPSSGQLTWIGTNSDGSQAAGTTLDSHLVASINSGNVDLTAETPTAARPHGSLTVYQSPSRTSIKGYYIVTLIY